MNFLLIIFWLLVAIAVLLPLSCSVYVLTSSSDHLYERWVRFRQRRSRLSLKDEHFVHFPKMLYGVRLLAVVVLTLGVAGLYFLLAA